MSRIALIAGEASGDQLGGLLMHALKQKQPDMAFMGVGGSDMEAHGLQSLFPMRDISLMGFAEVLPHIVRVKRRIRETIAYLEAQKPDVLVTIDSPGFTFRVVRALKKRGVITPKFVHYVAPTVWAYKPERAAKTAALFDSLMALLPFEPPYFTPHGLPTHFVGHPMAWQWREKGDGTACRNHHGIATDAPVIALFPGSRNAEIKRHMPLFARTIEALKTDFPALETLIQLRPENREALEAHTKHWPCPLHIETNAKAKKDVFAAADAALAKSGTIGLECALAQLPSVTVYKAHPISAWYIRRKLNTPYVNLANILCREEVIPERLQEDATPETIAPLLAALLRGESAQAKKLSIIPAMLGANETTSPSEKAADIVLAAL